MTIAKKNKIKISNKNKIQFVADRPGHEKRYAVNSNKIKREIKWKNKTSISSGLLQTFIWYSKNLNFFKKILEITSLALVFHFYKKYKSSYLVGDMVGGGGGGKDTKKIQI